MILIYIFIQISGKTFIISALKLLLMDKKPRYKLWRDIWRFIWEDDSLLSWIINVILAFVIIKFLVYPGMGLALGTKFPVVAVVSGSMEHDGNFDQWWQTQSDWYSRIGIKKSDFREFPFSDGFNKGEIMVLKGVNFERLKIGDVIVFYSSTRKEPIIHRVVKLEKKDKFYITTKGDHNDETYTFESNIPQDSILGRALFGIPYLGYIKIWFVELLSLMHIL